MEKLRYVGGNKMCAASVRMSNNIHLKLIGLVMGLLHFSIMASADLPSLEDRIHENGKCDLFHGKWIPNNSAPPYTNATCKYIQDLWNCMNNGRPDGEYLHWRWKPYNCNLHKFDPKKFLNAMRDKSLAMIGDSLLRNQMQSLLCLLSQLYSFAWLSTACTKHVERSADAYHGKAYKYMRWHFRSYNVTLANYWAPFLLQADSLTKGLVNVYLDKLENEWTTRYHNYDYIVLAAGPWFSTPTIILENNTVVGCHSCGGKFKELGSFYPYRRALQMAFNFITTSGHKPVVFFRTWSPMHTEYQEGIEEGFCNRSRPYHEGEYHDRQTGITNYAIDVEEFNKAAAIGSKNGTRLKLFDIYHLSLLRPDGHPGPYINFHPFDKDKNAQAHNDCGHWCLPGPIDTWNDLMAELVLIEGTISLNDAS